MNLDRTVPLATRRRAVRAAAAAVVAAAVVALQPAEAGPQDGTSWPSRDGTVTHGQDTRMADWFVVENTPWGAEGPAGTPGASGSKPTSEPEIDAIHAASVHS